MSITKILLAAVAFAFFISGKCIAQQLSNSQAKYHAFMPKTNDSALQSLFDDPAVEWYTEDEMPKLFQLDLQRPGRGQFISIYKDIGPGGGRNSNGNGEWPWAHPATPMDDGTVRNVIGRLVVGNVQTFPATFPTYTQHVTYGRVTGYSKYKDWTGLGWRFPPGTDFIELNTNRIGKYDYTFKIHRMTMQPNNEWLFRVYRPFVDVESYEKASGTKVGPAVRMTLEDTAHSIRAFKETALVRKIPPISAELARHLLLDTPFQLCTDDEFIPTTDYANQICPKRSLDPFLGNGTDQDNCRNCHRDVADNVRKFAAGDWYGLIRGGGNDRHNAGVFSWHPTIRDWYGRGSRPTESPGRQVAKMTNPVRRIIRQPTGSL